LQRQQSIVNGPQSDHSLRLSNFRLCAKRISELHASGGAVPQSALVNHRSWLRKVFAGTTIGRWTLKQSAG
jgi:hypothetical protein